MCFLHNFTEVVIIKVEKKVFFLDMYINFCDTRPKLTLFERFSSYKFIVILQFFIEIVIMKSSSYIRFFSYIKRWAGLNFLLLLWALFFTRKFLCRKELTLYKFLWQLALEFPDYSYIRRVLI